MELLVPWRLLVPRDAYQPLCGEDGGEVGRIATESGARIETAETGLLPSAFDGVVVTIQGTMWQKRTAGRQIVDRLFAQQGIDPQRWASGSGRLAVVLPAAARLTVESAEVSESVRVIGAGMRVAAPLAGLAAPARFLVLFEGNAQQVVSAVTRVNTALQDLADYGGLVILDFAEEGSGGAGPLSVAEAVRAARLAPAAGVATQPPHTHPRLAAIMPVAPAAEQARSTPNAQGLGSGAACSAGACAVGPGASAAPSSRPWNGHATSAFNGTEGSRLPLLFPRRVLDGGLLARGHLGEVAQRCGVRIDLEADTLPGDLRALTLTGTVVANAFAVLHLQWRAAQCEA